MPAKKKSPKKAPRGAARGRKPAAARGPEPRDSVIDPAGNDVAELAGQVKRHGGAVGGAYRILALNTEKAHNLRDRSLEVIRMARQLAKEQPRSKESEHAVTFESPAFLTLGCAYEQRSRFAGSSYQSVLNKVDRFLESTLPAALRQREQWAVRIMDIDDRVAAHVKTMQAMGMKSPYLRAVIVARINPVRFTPPSRKKDAAPPMSMAEALTKMAANVRKFDPKSIRPGDLALVAAIAPSTAD